MSEKRRSQRINFLGTGRLQHREASFFCRLENISMHGAMVDLRNQPIDSISRGEKCCLKLYQDVEGQQYTDFMATVIRFESSAVGLEFVEAEGVLKDVLENIVWKEQCLSGGARKIIDLAREVAGHRGVELSDVHFDKGELIPERDIHTLRFFAGEHTAKVHFHRAYIERYCVKDGAVPARMEILKAIDRLHG